MRSAPIGVKRRLDPAACAALCKHFFQKLLPFCVFGRAGMIISIQPLHAKFLLCHDGFIRWVVDLLAVDRIFIGMVLLSLFIRNLSHFSVDSSRFFRYCAGLTPYSFLNTQLKQSGLSYPTISAISPILYSVFSNKLCAFTIRRDRMYCAGLIFMYCLKLRINQFVLICSDSA